MTCQLRGDNLRQPCYSVACIVSDILQVNGRRMVLLCCFGGSGCLKWLLKPSIEVYLVIGWPNLRREREPNWLAHPNLYSDGYFKKCDHFSASRYLGNHTVLMGVQLSLTLGRLWLLDPVRKSRHWMNRSEQLHLLKERYLQTIIILYSKLIVIAVTF